MLDEDNAVPVFALPVLLREVDVMDDPEKLNEDPVLPEFVRADPEVGAIEDPDEFNEIPVEPEFISLEMEIVDILTFDNDPDNVPPDVVKEDPNMLDEDNAGPEFAVVREDTDVTDILDPNELEFPVEPKFVPLKLETIEVLAIFDDADIIITAVVSELDAPEFTFACGVGLVKLYKF